MGQGTLSWCAPTFSSSSGFRLYHPRKGWFNFGALWFLLDLFSSSHSFTSSIYSYSKKKNPELKGAMENEEKITRRFMPDVLRRYRDKAGLSQQELADSIGVSKGFISALEGGRSVPNLDRLVQIADALQVDPGELVNAMVADAEKGFEQND